MENIAILWISTVCIIRMIKSKRMRWAGQVACIVEVGNSYKSIIGKPEELITLGRTRRRWKDNIRVKG
jgi:hypothetical protein